MAAASSSSSSLPFWLRCCVEKQPALDLDLNLDLNEEEEEKRKKKKKKQVAVELDFFRRLPDEVVMVIVDKLFHLKTLLRFSLAAKRYYALASHTHSLVADLSVASCPDVPAAAAEGFLARSGKQKVCAIIHHFQHIKRLHLYLPKPPLSSNGNGNGVFSRWVAVFGSKFEQFLFISAASVNPPLPGMNTVAVEEPWFDLFQNIVKIATKKHEIAKRLLVSQCEKVETAMFFDSFQGGALLMGKPQIAKLRASHHLDHSPPPLPPLSSLLAATYHQILLAPPPAIPPLRIAGYHFRTLDLPKTGYSLKGVNVVSAIYDDQDQQPIVEVIGGCEEMLNGGDEWDVFTEAAALVSNGHENKETMYDFLFPF